MGVRSSVQAALSAALLLTAAFLLVCLFQNPSYTQYSTMAEPDQETLRNAQETNEDHSEKGGEDVGPPAPVGFWDHRLKKVRHTAFKK